MPYSLILKCATADYPAPTLYPDQSSSAVRSNYLTVTEILDGVTLSFSRKSVTRSEQGLWRTKTSACLLTNPLSTLCLSITISPNPHPKRTINAFDRTKLSPLEHHSVLPWPLVIHLNWSTFNPINLLSIFPFVSKLNCGSNGTRLWMSAIKLIRESPTPRHHHYWDQM